MPSFPVLHPGVCSNKCPLSPWCHPTIFTSVVPFYSCILSFPVSGSFPKSQLFPAGDQSIGVSASFQSFLWIFRVNYLYDWLVWSLCSPRDSQRSSSAPFFESINSLAFSLLYGQTLTSIHDYWKNQALTIWTSVNQVMSLLLNTLSRFLIAFLPRSKCPLISWLQSPSAVILEPSKKKSVTVSIVFPLFVMKD